MDEDTDKLIQAAIRKACTTCTVITIAHRLNTIMDYDKVMVLGGGHLLEFDAPHTLLKNPASQFAQLVSSGAGVKRTRSRENKEAFV